MRELPHEHLLDLALESAAEPRRAAEFRQAIREIRERVKSDTMDQGFALEFLLTRTMAVTRSTGTALATASGNDLVCIANSGPTVPELGATSNSKAGISAECLRSGKVIYCKDSDSDPLADREACRFLGVRAIIMAPFPANADPLGVVQVYSSVPEAFGDRDLARMPSIARTLANIVATREFEDADAAPDAVAREAGVSPQYAEFLGELLGPNAKDFPNADLPEGSVVPPQEPSLDAEMPFTRALGTQVDWNNLEQVVPPTPSAASVAPPPPPSRNIYIPPPPEYDPFSRRRPAHASDTAGVAEMESAELETEVQLEVAEPAAVASAAASQKPDKPDVLANILEFAVPAAITAVLIAVGVYWNNNRKPPDNPIVFNIPAPSFDSFPDLSRAKEKIAAEIPTPDISFEQQDGAAAVRTNAGPGVVFRVEPSKEAQRPPPKPGSSNPTSRSYTLGRVMVPPEVMKVRLVRMVAPLNPAGTRGTVVLRSVIDKTGQVKSVELAKGNPMLAPWAITAVTQWRYLPYLREGRPVDVETDITIVFQ